MLILQMKKTCSTTKYLFFKVLYLDDRWLEALVIGCVGDDSSVTVRAIPIESSLL